MRKKIQCFLMTCCLLLLPISTAFANTTPTALTPEILATMSLENYLKTMNTVATDYGLDALIIFNTTVESKVGAILSSTDLQNLLSDSNISPDLKKYLIDVASLHDKATQGGHSPAFENLLKEQLFTNTILDDSVKHTIYQTIQHFTPADVPQMKAQLQVSDSDRLNGAILLTLADLDGAYVLDYAQNTLSDCANKNQTEMLCSLNALEKLSSKGNAAATHYLLAFSERYPSTNSPSPKHTTEERTTEKHQNRSAILLQLQAIIQNNQLPKNPPALQLFQPINFSQENNSFWSPIIDVLQPWISRET